MVVRYGGGGGGGYQWRKDEWDGAGSGAASEIVRGYTRVYTALCRALLGSTNQAGSSVARVWLIIPLLTAERARAPFLLEPLSCHPGPRPYHPRPAFFSELESGTYLLIHVAR